MSLQHLLSVGSARAQSIAFLHPLLLASSVNSDRPSPIPDDIAGNPLATLIFNSIRRIKTVDVNFTSLDAIILVLDPPPSHGSPSPNASTAASWSDFCFSTGFGAFLLLGCSDSILSLVFLGTVGDPRSTEWDSIGAIGCELSIAAPEHVLCVSTSLLNDLPEVLTAAQNAISSRLKTPTGSSSGDNIVAGLGAAFAPFLSQNQQTLEMVAKGSSGGSSPAKELDRSRVIALRGMVDDPRRFFALFTAPQGANDDDGGGGAVDGVIVSSVNGSGGAAVIAPAPATAASVTLPTAKQIDRHAHAVAIRSKLASITGLTVITTSYL